jgi:hypothetical protein
MEYCSRTITVLDIIHRPVFHLKHDASKTGFCLQVEHTQLVQNSGNYTVTPSSQIYGS